MCVASPLPFLDNCFNGTVWPGRGDHLRGRDFFLDGDCWKGFFVGSKLPTKWAPTIAIEWSYGTPINGLFKLITGVITPRSGVITLLITGRGPLCIFRGMEVRIKWWIIYVSDIPTRVEDEKLQPSIC